MNRTAPAAPAAAGPDTAPRRTLAVLAATYAVGGWHHGFFEALQGNRPTGGFFIDSIGPEHIRWVHGTDPAFTLLHNFLATGVAAMLVSVAILVWAVRGARGGAWAFLGLFVLLTLVGGGVGHVLFFVVTWAYAKRMDGPRDASVGSLSPPVRAALARTWAPALVASSACFVVGLEVSVFGLPGVADPGVTLAVCWGFLGLSLLLLNLAWLAAFARARQAGPGPARAVVV